MLHLKIYTYVSLYYFVCCSGHLSIMYQWSVTTVTPHNNHSQNLVGLEKQTFPNRWLKEEDYLPVWVIFIRKFTAFKTLLCNVLFFSPLWILISISASVLALAHEFSECLFYLDNPSLWYTSRGHQVLING